MRSIFLVACVSLLFAGCVTTPQFEKISGVTPKSVVDVIECELITAREKIKARNDALKRKGVPGKDLPSLNEWIAVAELTLQVDEQFTLSPSLTHTDVVSKSLTRAFDWGVKFDTQSQRIYTETVNFNIGRLDNKGGKCDEPPTRVSLNGNLGLEEVIELAFGSIDPDDVGIQHPGDTARRLPGAGKPAAAPPAQLRRAPGVQGGGGGGGVTRAGSKKKDDKSKRENAFGTSIEFVVIKALNPTGPTWTLAHFKGPGKLFSASRDDTHKLRISFARGDGAEKQAGEQNLKLLFEGTSPRSFLRQLQ